MHRYRVNLPLLIGLVVGTVVLAGGTLGLYAYQKSRNASRLLDREEMARAEGNLKQSSKLLIDYLHIRPGDEEAMARLSTTLGEIAEQPQAEPVDFRNAISQYEATVRDYPQRDDLRRDLVDLYMSKRAYKQSLDHISQLLNHKPGDPELEVMRSQCYFAVADSNAIDHGFRLIGFDEDTGEFDAEKAISPDETTVYVRVARALREDRSDPEFADRVIEQMVEANPDSGMAYLSRGQYLEMYEETDEALPDIAKALELDPDNPSIVIANARMMARENEDYAGASALLEKALEKHPEDAGLYQSLADMSIRQEDLKGALAWCDKGVAAVPIDQSPLLMFQKARLQIQSESPETTRKTIAEIRDRAVMPEAYPEYLEARLLMAENKWFEAAQLFEKNQTFLSANPMLGVELNVMLALCRENLGQNELAVEAYDQALQLEPDNMMADLGRKRVLQRIGRSGGDSSEGVSIYTALAEELAKPESEQDWAAFDKLSEEYVERMHLGDAMLDILRGEVLMRRKKYDEAREMLKRAFAKDPTNLGVRRAAVKLFAADPEQGPAKALSLLDKVVKDNGDLPILRLERADLLAAINDENLTEQLFALTEGIDDWDDQQKVQLWKGLADKFSRLNNEEARAECLRHVAELAPDDLPSLLDIFEVARAAGDVDGMRKAQDAVFAVVGSKENPTWQFTEAQRLLFEWRAAGGQGDAARRAEEMVDQALANRGEWHQLHNLKADISLARGDIRGAVASYDRAADLGRQDARSMYQYIKLLMNRRRYADALTQMERIGRDGRLRLLGKDYAEALLFVGRGPEAVVVAEEFSEAAPNNPAVQLWLGRFLTQASALPNVAEDRKEELLASAGDAFRSSVEANPQSAESWLALVVYYAATGKPIEADDTIREAQLALVEDQNLLMFARCYETVGRRLDAEALYEQAFEQAEEADRPRVARMLAQFYLGSAYRLPDGIAKATPLVNEILKDAAEGVIKEDDPNAHWARTTAAKLLAQSGAYQDLRNAERLIASNSDDGELPVEDRLLMAEILTPRPEPVSRMKAVQLLEEIGENQRLSQKSELDLAKLYFALGDWRKCREQMLDVIGRYPEDKSVRLAYIEMLLQRGGPSEVDLAVRQVQRLQELAPNDLSTREMLARVAYEKGKKQQAANALLSMLPRDASKIGEEQLPLVNRIAQRLVGFEDLQRAQKLFELAASVGGPREQYALAQFLGEHVDADKGLDELEKLRDDLSPQQVVQGGLVVLRTAENEGDAAPEAMVDRVAGWLERGLREDPEAIPLLLQEAEIADLRRDYETAAARYRKLLDRKDLRGSGRAVVLNNLAYLLALSSDDKAAISDADRYLAEAVDLLGPGSEILDTRAVIAIADGRYNDAIEDLKLAVIDRPTASKYFHLALAYAKAGRMDAAKEEWRQALDRGLTRESVTRLEKSRFDELKAQMDAGGDMGLTSASR